MPKKKTPYIDKQVEGALKHIVAQGDPYFTKNEVLAHVLNVKRVAKMMVDLRKRYSSIGAPAIIEGFILSRISVALQAKAGGRRIYENYKAGSEYRWMRLSSMTITEMRAVVAERRAGIAADQAVVDAYLAIIDELEELGEGATVGDVLAA